MAKPIVILRTPALGGAALNTLPADLWIPSLEDILPYAPFKDHSEAVMPYGPAKRIGYDK